MTNFLEQLFCRHEWEKTLVSQEIDEDRNIRYGLRRYVCRKCGKTSIQDSRNDHLAEKAVHTVKGSANDD